jgi:hypothetical protein
MDLRKANAGSLNPFAELFNQLEAMGVSQSVIEQETLAQSKQFQNDGKGSLRHVETGQTMTEWVAKLRDTKPHWFPEYVDPETAEKTEADALIDAATLTPSPKTIGALIKAVGEKKGMELLKAAGVDLKPINRNGDMRPGKKITGAAGDKPAATEDVVEARSKNPWSRHYVGPKGQRGPNFTAQGALVRALGADKAAAIARAASSYLGATKAYD